MAQTRRVGDLQVEQDLEFQRNEWKVERAGWVIMALLTLAALLGLFGTGPISRATAGQNVFVVDYERFLRYQAPAQLTVEFDPSIASAGQMQIGLEQSYLNHFQVEQIVPEPADTEIDRDQVIYTFTVNEAGEPAEIKFSLIAEQVGSVSGRVTQVGGQEARIRQFVYP